MSNSSALQPPPQKRLAAWGFHAPMLVFALRTALAAFAAMAIAYALGLEHPHWAAMSAWAASQPMREHLLSRGIYRLGGSVVGVMYAVLLVLVAQDSIWVLALSLTLWVAACAFWGNLQRGYMVYGCMLAGYSTAMVVLLHHGPASSIWALGWDRVLTVVTGVVLVLGVSWFFAPRRKSSVLIAQSRHAMAQVLEATSAGLRRQPVPAALDHVHLQAQLAEVEELLDLYREGSSTARRTTRAMHRQQFQAMELVYHLTQSPADDPLPAAQRQLMALALDTLCQALRQPPAEPQHETTGLKAALDEAITACEAAVHQVHHEGQKVPALLNVLGLLLQEMRRAEHAEHLDLPGSARLSRRAASVMDRHTGALPLHRDWVGARQAAIRAGGTLLVFGALWAVTGWHLIAFGMLGLSVMLLVFSSFENPHRTMLYVLRGQLIGAMLALLCQWLVWPWAPSGWAMVWMLIPFTLLGALAFANKRTAAGGMDTNMVMFILLAPVFPYTLDMGKSLSMALAIVSGPALAWLVYRSVYPTTGVHRMRTLAQMMLAEVPALAQRLLQEGKPSTMQAARSAVAVPSGAFWQARLHHRTLRLVRWADKTRQSQRGQFAEMGLALRFVQASLLELQQWRRETVLATPALRRAERQAELALRRTARWGQGRAPGEGAQRTAQAWQRLSEQPGLPPALASQAHRVAERDLPMLDEARRELMRA